jgi:hypothetical protein
MATNLGLTRMAEACGIPYDMLRWTHECYVRDETLREANTVIVAKPTPIWTDTGLRPRCCASRHGLPDLRARTRHQGRGTTATDRTRCIGTQQPACLCAPGPKSGPTHCRTWEQRSCRFIRSAMPLLSKADGSL